MKVRKPILENPVYCQIIYAIGNEKRYVNDLIKNFRPVDLSDYDYVKKKSQPVLREQLLLLKREGYVDVADEQEKGKKFAKNKKMFYLKWEKITEEFINFLIRYYLKQRQDYSAIRRGKPLSDYMIKHLKENKGEYKTNYFLKNSFIEIIEDFSHFGTQMTLNDLFKNIIDLRLMEKIKQEILKRTGFEELEFKDKIIFKQMFSKEIGQERMQDYEVFDDLINNIDSQTAIFEHLAYGVAYHIGINLIGEENLRERSKQADLDEENPNRPPYYPITEDQLSISKEDVLKVIQQIEKIRKNKQFSDYKNLKKFLIELKYKFYFVYELPKAYLSLAELRDEKRITILKRELVSLEIGLITHYKLVSEVSNEEIWQDFSDMVLYKGIYKANK